MNLYNRVDNNNPRMLNQNMASRPRAPIPNNTNTRFVYIASQNNFAPNQNTITNVPITQTQQAQNQNSITNKLGKFFKNLLELEKDQGRSDESVAIIQRYINKEINVEELGTQLKGSASKTPLPESLMTSLKSNIDDLRREMFHGRVKIDRINPPPENVIEMNTPTPLSGPMLSNPVSSAGIARMSTPQMVPPRPNLFVQQTNAVTRQMQPQAAQQIIRQTAPPCNRMTRPIGNTTAVFTPQATLSISNANLRSIAPSSPIRQSVQNVSTSGIRTVAVSTSVLSSVKPVSTVKSESEVTMVVGSGGGGADGAKIAEPHCHNVTLPTNIVNHANYRTKIAEAFKSESGGAVSISEEALHYISEAIENFSSSLMEQAAAFACHRQEVFLNDPMYKKIDDVRSQMKFLQTYEEHQRSSEEERQKAELFKAAKSRSKIDNQEQQKIKETVRKMQEHDKNCDEYLRANSTALKAIGNKRKAYDAAPDDASAAIAVGIGNAASALQQGQKTARTAFVTRPGLFNNEFAATAPGSQMYITPSFLPGKQARGAVPVGRHRNKRIILKDFQLVLDQDAKLKRFKTFKKIFMFGRY